MTQSLFSALGEALDPGTSTLPNKVIYEMSLEPTTDHLIVKLGVGFRDNEDYYDTEIYEINHANLEAWLERNGDLDGDEDREVYGSDGHPMTVAVPYRIDYFNWLTDPLIDKEETIIEYMKFRRIIPSSYEYCPDEA